MSKCITEGRPPSTGRTALSGAKTGAGAGADALLGITAKSSVGHQQGMSRGRGKAKGKATDKAGRAQRYAAHSTARELLRADALKRFPGEYPGDVHRTCDCRYVNHGSVGVHFTAAHQSAHYGGLVTCGSVWACPICAAKIQERRRLEIEQGIEWALLNGLQPIMVTFTFPHRAFHTLRELLDRQAEAFRLLRQTTRWRKLMKRLGFQGLIRSLEVTHGVNGWHPHTHELWFVDPSVGTALQVELVDLWQAACVSAGLLDDSDAVAVWAFGQHSVDVRCNATAGAYLAKQDDSRSWGMAHEVAKATSKAGRAKGCHPHHFLIRQAPGDAERYLEYVQGMKGRRQLFWSPGLKAKAGIGDASDDELAKDQREAADLLALLPPEVWKVVRGNDARAELLDAAERDGADGIALLLWSLGVEFTPPPSRGGGDDGPE